MNWSDGVAYKWLETLAHLYAVTGEKILDRELDKWIRIIGKAQWDDGSISTNAQIDEMKNQGGSHGDVKSLDNPHTHQLYNMGHLITAGVIQHRATGKQTFLRIAKKTANFLDRTFRPTPEELIHFPWNPSVYMGLIELYHTTEDERYLKLADTLIGNRGADPWDPAVPSVPHRCSGFPT